MLEVRGLTKSYPSPLGRRYVFRDLNFRFPPQSNIGLIGRNGAGKSTLLRLLGGIDTPDRGEIVTDARISFPIGLAGGLNANLTPFQRSLRPGRSAWRNVGSADSVASTKVAPRNTRAPGATADSRSSAALWG